MSLTTIEYEAMTNMMNSHTNDDKYAVITSEPTYANVKEKSSSPVYATPPSPCPFDPQIPPTLPISLDDLGTHVASCHSDGNAAFSEQYKVMSDVIN